MLGQSQDLRTSTILHTSFSVLHRLTTPSKMAPAMYFSKDKETMSLRMSSRFSASIDRRNRLMSTVWHFSFDDSGGF